MVKNNWDIKAASQVQKGVEELVYRSNLIGSDRAVCGEYGEKIIAIPLSIYYSYIKD